MLRLAITIDGQVYDVELDFSSERGDELDVRVNGEPSRVQVPGMGAPLEAMDWLIVDGRPHEVIFDPDLRWIRGSGGIHLVEVRDREATLTRPLSGDGRVKAPIPGLIRRVLVAPDQRVEAGQPLVVLEAMKMENEIRAPFEGVVVVLNVQPGQTVTRGELIIEVTPA
jgi:acetyl/propionyl-CoA carboxylase alpha subunit